MPLAFDSLVVRAGKRGEGKWVNDLVSPQGGTKGCVMLCRDKKLSLEL